MNEEELNDACERAYNKTSLECRSALVGTTAKDAPPVSMYAIKKNGRFYPSKHFTNLRAQGRYDGDKNEEMIQENMEKMENLLSLLRRRNP